MPHALQSFAVFMFTDFLSAFFYNAPHDEHPETDGISQNLSVDAFTWSLFFDEGEVDGYLHLSCRIQRSSPAL